MIRSSTLLLFGALALALGGGGLLRAQSKPAPAPKLEPTPAPLDPAPLSPYDVPALESDDPLPPAFEPVPVQTWIEAQVALHRRGFSCGSIDGVPGAQTAAALRAFQRMAGLKDTGALNRETGEALLLTAPVLKLHTFTAEELATLQPVATTWVGKSAQTALAYATALELVAERYRANPRYLRRLNPDVDWDAVLPGTTVAVPDVGRPVIAGIATKLHVRLAEREIEATDETGRVIAHFPVSIARKVEKRPVGELHITVVIPNPDYTFDPAVFPESAEARELGRKLIIPPGPNNPVGLAWIGLNLPGYGIHGTPDPEHVGRTESHGCFRLANWDALTLLSFAWVGMPVVVEP